MRYELRPKLKAGAVIVSLAVGLAGLSLFALRFTSSRLRQKFRRNKTN